MSNENIEKTEKNSSDTNSHEQRNRLMDFLNNPEAVKAVESLLDSALSRFQKGTGQQHWFLGICLLVIVGAVVGLSVCGALEPSAGVILGSLVGYLFGKKEG